MISNNDLKRYQKKRAYSYAFGPFPTFELLQNQPQVAEKVLVHSTASAEIRAKAQAQCDSAHIPLVESDRVLERVREKDNCVLAGVFRKYSGQLAHGTDHVVLVHPSDSGNLGTIMRSCVGFGIRDLAIIEPAVDVFHPKTVRASMGSLFHLRIHCFQNFAAYMGLYAEERDLYPFMLQAPQTLAAVSPRDAPFSLLFGNEASGLDESYLEVGQSVRIAHTGEIDSLNLSLAAGIGIYEFTKRRFPVGERHAPAKGNC